MNPGRQARSRMFAAQPRRAARGDATITNPGLCYGPPPGPPGVLAEEMAAQLKANGDLAAQHSPTDLLWFKSQVGDNAPWDYKRYDPAFENFGNYNYGYTGTRQGLPPALLRGMAGLVQVKDGTSRWAFRSSDFDDPRDQDQINRGIHDALNGCY